MKNIIYAFLISFLSIFSVHAEIEDTSEWKEVIIGPETASQIPAFLNKTWK